MINPRYYQQESHDSVISWVKSTAESCVIELPTGAGKSVVVAMIANTLNQISKGKHVLCIVPKKELVEQNAEKLRLVGGQCSMFSASVGETCLKHALVVGTPVSIKNQLHRFGSKFCAVIIDECHQITPTVKTIIEALREHNPNLRVIGLSATPYRLGQGFVYGIDQNGKMLDESQAKEPYFKRLVYRLEARELIEQGFLSNPVIGATNTHYDTSGLTQNRMGNFDSSTVDKAFIGKGRLTSSIVADIVEKSQGRKGVMIFAATIQHAHEILESLPKEISAIVTGEPDKKHERKLNIELFQSQKIKYIVNVDVLTTGFDAVHVDVVAMMRATESVALLQQIIGRGLRICDGKTDCLVLDYAENIERHCPDGDVFNPEIKASGGGEVGVPVKAKCPSCNGVNEFSKRRDVDKEQPIDANGYLLDLEGNRIEVEGLGAMPAHYGRRCTFTVVNRGVIDRCSYRWTFKECEECGFENDIASRYCQSCKCEIIDPNAKLKLEHAQIKDASILQTEECLDVNVTPTLSKAGNDCLRVKFTTPTRVFMVWFNKSTPKQTIIYAEFDSWFNFGIKTVTYQKDKTGFFKVYGYNKEVGL
jgi:DNA repair protein RadD